jgi:2',3'-cyclic-nucleotide 2'-phosphodiesterase (5'-nucleotidase family)
LDSHRVTVRLLHTTDLHDRRTLFPLIASRGKDADTLILDSGDALRGSNTLFFSGEPILDRMRESGYDALAVGNREFHYMRSVAESRVRQAGFPFLCANVRDSRGVLNSLWKPFIIRTVGGARIGIAGVTPPQFSDSSIWAKLTGITFVDLPDTMRDLREGLQGKTDVNILLSHLGLKEDRRLAESTDLFHIILGGHSHKTLEQPLQVGSTTIVHSGSYGRALGEMKLTVVLSREASIENIQWTILTPR